VCILLVEDEFLVRAAMAEALKANGYNVWEAETGVEAIEAILRPPFVFSALVTDYQMPGVATGVHLAGILRKKLPDVPVIIATGKPEIFRVRWAKDLGYRLLPKPYTPSELVNLVSEMVTGQAMRAAERG